MLRRLLIVIVIALVIVFVPYWVGKWNYFKLFPMAGEHWLLGWMYIVLSFAAILIHYIVYLILKAIFNYIKDGN